MGGFPQVGVFNRQRPIQCARCGAVGTRHPTKFGCVCPCPHDAQPPVEQPPGQPPPPPSTPTPPPPGVPPTRQPGAFTAQPGPNGPNGGGSSVPVPATSGAQPGALAAPIQGNNPNGNGNGNGMQNYNGSNGNAGAHPSRPRPEALPGYEWATQQSWPQYSPSCPPIGAPFPCRPYMDPRSPNKVYGCQLPCDRMRCDTVEEAVKQLCWVETTLRSETPVDPGETISFDVEVKWWMQFQKVQNLGDQVNATFDLEQIRYGQSNYSLEIEELRINGVGVPQNGIDVRRWNQTNFVDKFYPFPAMGLNDPLTLVFRNVSANAQDLELLFGGPAVLQIG